MDKLEQYLDQVCRRIGGPRTLRQHIRQELGEHLKDAVAEHQAAGLPAEEALTRALDDFGKPDEVRSELEAAHGHSLMAVVIDKAIEWKEATMKPKWLWASWAYLALAGVILLELMWIYCASVFIVPKFQRLMQVGIIDPDEIEKSGIGWAISFLIDVKQMVRYSAPILFLTAVVWGLFERCVRSENKPFMRMSALGTAGLGLAFVSVLMGGTMTIAFALGAPAIGRLARPFAVNQVAQIDSAFSVLRESLAKQDWEATQNHLAEASQGLDKLAVVAVANALTLDSDPLTVDELRADIKAGKSALQEAQKAVNNKDLGQMETVLFRFNQSFEPVRARAQVAAKALSK